MKLKAKDQAYKHGIAPGDTLRVLLGKGKHSDKITTATSVTAKEIVTPLGVVLQKVFKDRKTPWKRN